MNAEHPANDATPAGAPDPPAPRRALIVENDLAGRELLARVLRLRGFDARTVLGAGPATVALGTGEPGDNGMGGERVAADPRAAEPLAEPPADPGGERLDLLIVDLDVEGPDPIDLLRHVAALPEPRRPRRLVAIGESLARHYPRLGELQLDLELLQKPVHLPSLMTIIG